MALEPGRRLGPHEILGPLGQGGMGEVYRARDTRLGREVAIKILPPALASDKERLRLLDHEARAASALNHPNIVTIYEIGREGDTSYIAMELVEGSSLRDLVSAGPLPVRRLLSIAAQVADGLAKAHAAGIVHRDLKPENLMVSNDGFVKILDFGLAKVVPVETDSSSEESTSSHDDLAGGVAGTVGYMSPEQASGKPIDFRSDQFSLGSVLYELATGNRAFRRGTPVQTLAAILEDEPEPIASRNARLPAPFVWIVERCLTKDREERYASTRDMARDLAALREHLSGRSETVGPRASNLPVPRTHFVGREKERAAVRALLERPGVRVVSLTGFGGIGKTRLALQVAEDMTPLFPAGVSFVPLESARDAEQMVAAICRTIGVRETTGQTLRDSLKEQLGAGGRSPRLLVLDNFEQLAAAAPAVADLVAAAPGIKVLVTSRSPLHVYGEHELPVPPLGLPDLDALPPLETLTENESVALFLQQAQAIKPDFALTKENAPQIAEICARLDGLPLALELAAARVKLLSPAAMQSRLEKRLQLLTGGALDLPARQRTLRGAIEWSHDLLDEDEQKLFRRLSVFLDGCTLEASEAVCNAKEDLQADILDGMSSMVDKSLMRQIDAEREEPRFVMLETIREYALERLAASGDEPITRRAHAAYCLVLAEEIGSARVTAVVDSAEWLDQCEREHGNLRAALDWLCRNDQGNWGLRLGGALFQFWERREYISQGRHWLAKLLALPSAAPRDRVRARAVFAAGVLAYAQRDYALAHTLLGESLEINRETDDKWAAAVSLNALAVTALDRRDVAAARSLSEQNLELWRELGDRAAVGRSLSNLASVVKEQGDYALARSLYDEALATFREMGDETAAARVMNKQGDVARAQGDAAGAKELYEQSLATFRQFGDRWGTALSLADLGNLAREEKDFTLARSLYRESLRIFQELDYKRGVAQILESFAFVASAEGAAQRALSLAGSAAALRHALGTPLAPADQAKLELRLDTARRSLPGSEGTSAWMEGWTKPLDDTVEAVLGADGG
jgi:predicted ATPase